MTATAADTGTDTWALLSDDQVLAALREAEQAERRAHHAKVLAVAELENRRFAQRNGYPSTQRLLRDVLKTSDGVARALVGEADRVGYRRTMGGQPLQPKHPHLAQGLAAGLVNSVHYGMILRAIDQLGDHMDPDLVDLYEAALVEHAPLVGPQGMRKYIHEHKDRLEQLSPPPNDDEPEPEPATSGNRLHFQPKLDGGAVVTGELDALGYATVRTVLDSLNEPVKGPDGQRDERTRPHRDGDALVEAMERVLHQGELPIDGGVRPQVAVTVDYDVLRRAYGNATLDTGDTITAGDLRRLACDARILPVIMDGPSGNWDIGHDKYRVTGSMRRLLIQRDKHCVFPECRRPAGWCHAHHIISFLTENGPSQLENLCLLCPQHHRLVHASDWEIQMIDGRPWFRPPAFIDPQRTLLFNGEPPDTTSDIDGW